MTTTTIEQREVKGVLISLAQWEDGVYEVFWQGKTGKNNHPFEDIEQARELFHNWCNFAKSNPGEIPPKALVRD